VITIIAYGDPAPQGSKKFVGIAQATGRGILVESSKRVKPWRQDVEHAAREAMQFGKLPALDEPLYVRMVFTMPKPKSAKKRSRTYPMRKPDVSKLCRSTEDALTTGGVWADDSRVVEYLRLAKVFPGEDPEALNLPGVLVQVLTVAEAIEQVTGKQFTVRDVLAASLDLVGGGKPALHRGVTRGEGA
jgi:Holliday junction resolvase RusA-like endonuclease